MPDDMKPTSHHIETATDPAAFAHWPDGMYEEMLTNQQNGCVGSVLVSETDKLRVWHLHIPPRQTLCLSLPCEPLFLVGALRRHGAGLFFQRRDP